MIEKDEKVVYSEDRINEMRMASWVTQQFNEAKSNRAERDKLDEACLEAYHRVSDDSSKPDWASKHTSNYIKTTIESIRPILTDNNPQFQVLARSPEGRENADAMQMLLDYEWDRAEMNVKLPKLCLTSLVTGTGILYLKWNGNLNRGKGDVDPIIIDPKKVFFDPSATGMDDTKYVIYADWMHIKDVKDAFPERADEIHGQSISDDTLFTQPLATVPQRNMILVLEMWMKDTTYVEIEENIDGEVVKKKKKRYPFGRVVTTLPQSGLVLSDRHNPYIDGEFPFVLFKDYDIPFEILGRGDVEHLLSPQKYMDELNNAILDNAKHTANTVWVIDKNSGIPKGSLKNREGLVIRKNPGTEVSRPAPPSMPGYVQYKVEELKADIENIAGVHDVTKGKAAGGVTAAQAIMALQEAGQARIRLKVKVLEHALTKLGNMWMSRIHQFWTDDRLIRVIDKNEKYHEARITTKMLKEKYDVRITAGSTMPSNKNAMLDMMIRLAQTPAEDGMPVADRESMLEFMPVSSKRGLIERFEARKKSQEDQIAEQYQQQMEAMTQVMEQLVKEVEKISKELEKEKEDKMKMEQFNKGYEAGQNGENLTNEQKYGIIQGDNKIPDEILEEIQSLSDEDMAQLLQMIPNLDEVLANNQ